MRILQGRGGRPGSRGVRGTIEAEAVGPYPALELRVRPGRDTMLVIAIEPLLSVLADLGRRASLGVQACLAPLDAIHALECSGARLACAIISTTPLWGLEVRRLIAQDYPDIDRITVLV